LLADEVSDEVAEIVMIMCPGRSASSILAFARGWCASSGWNFSC
jgi:hypothetical protein